ncbi:TPA: hypothetical protein HA318_00405 [Candidatus Micrarchaeota archaeon]|nr:MAG: hypothetical protein AUJ65_04840 [Candidatus Micrarchaeota archaeon CG1_02_51_15]HII38452.1 hypothetical protein [Candidatus Micrarchaeota archaeon]
MKHKTRKHATVRREKPAFDNATLIVVVMIILVGIICAWYVFSQPVLPQANNEQYLARGQASTKAIVTPSFPEFSATPIPVSTPRPVNEDCRLQVIPTSEVQGIMLSVSNQEGFTATRADDGAPAYSPKIAFFFDGSTINYWQSNSPNSPSYPASSISIAGSEITAVQGENYLLPLSATASLNLETYYLLRADQPQAFRYGTNGVYSGHRLIIGVEPGSTTASIYFLPLGSNYYQKTQKLYWNDWC